MAKRPRKKAKTQASEILQTNAIDHNTEGELNVMAEVNDTPLQPTQTEDTSTAVPIAQTTRYQLPTEIESVQSRALIDEWENQMKDAANTIESLNESLKNELHAIERRLLIRIKREQAAARASTEQQIEPLQVKIEILSQQLEKEKAFLAPIRRLPPEIITEFISLALTDGIKKQLLSLVSKTWRDIILNTPKFWREIVVSAWGASEDSLRRLKRVLELSGSVTLDVTLRYKSEKHEVLLEHFKAIADAGIHRWRSLNVWSCKVPRDGRQNPIAGIFTGSLSSLRSLSTHRCKSTPEEQDVFEPIYSLIEATRPCIHHYTGLGSQTSDTLFSSSIFHNLKSISGNFATISSIRPKLDVPDLHITGRCRPGTFKAFELPQSTIFDSIVPNMLFKCGLNHVQVLIIRNPCRPNQHDDYDNSNINLLFPWKPFRAPSLHTLQIKEKAEKILPWLLDMDAPNLTHLTITDEFYGADPRATAPTIHHVFEEEKHRIRIPVTHLDLRMQLTIVSTMQILKRWPQLQYLTLQWNQKFKWSGNLLNGLCRKNNPLCPELQVLRIVMHSGWSQGSIDAWLDAARQILKARKNFLPLWKVILTHDDRFRPPNTVTVFEIE